MRTYAIIQARLGSQRLGGKSLMKIQGRSILKRVVDRVRAVNVISPGLLDDIIVATTTKPEDHLIEAWCERHSVDCFRGEPENLLKRYYDCATKIGAEWVLRVTGDCPLIDPFLLVGLLEKQPRAEYQALAVNRSAIIDGHDSELFSYRELHRVYSKHGHDPHVTTKMRKADSDFSDHGTPFNYHGIKYSIDTQADFDRVAQLVEYL